MAYLVNKTNGDLLVSVADGTANTAASDLTFIGKNYVGYGEILNENFLKLLENFSSTTQPPRAILGQVWYDSSANRLKVYNGSQFKATAFLTYASASPSGAVNGDLWFDSDVNKIYVYKAGSWIEIGLSSIVEETVTDNTSTEHTVSKISVAGTLVAVISKDSAFIPNPAISGFAAIVPGVNISDAITGAGLRTPSLSVANNATVQGNVTVTGNISSTTGNVSGYDGNFSHHVTANRFNGDLLGDVTGNVSGYITGNVRATDNSVIINASTKAASVGDLSAAGNLTVTGNLTINGTTTTVNSTTVTVDDPIFTLGGDTAPASNDGRDRGIEFRWHTGLASRLGFFGFDRSTQRFTAINDATNTGDQFSGTASDAQFGTVYATATTAQYGDLAEYYLADRSYEPGTVLIFGGSAEVTDSSLIADTRVAGVVSTDPAYIMNNAMQNQPGAVAIALRGRVPCKVVGPVNKGDLLVTSVVQGYAAVDNSASAMAVFAKSLENNPDPGAKIITVVVCG